MRTDDDSWDITAGVGATALQVALGRMAESASEAPLFSDPYAQHFVEDALDRGWRPPFGEDLLAELAANEPLALDRLRAMGDYTAVRTRYFDDFFVAATNDGIDQAVILAAGLDARAWRLPWPCAATVYEIDQPDVLEFKARILQRHGAEPAARYVPVGIDLRREWPKTLQEHGFDPSQPTAWVAEGLLPYLPADGQDRLFDHVDTLSAGGSRIAVEAFGTDFYHPRSAAERSARLGVLRQAAQRVGAEVDDVQELFFLEERTDVADWFDEKGWATASVEALDLMAHYGRDVPENIRDGVIKSVFVQARMPSS